MEDKYYTIEQVAELLGLHHKTIRKFISDGTLDARKVGKQWRIADAEVRRLTDGRHETVRMGTAAAAASHDAEAAGSKLRVNVSAVVDVLDADRETYLRISNTLIAVMNARAPGSGPASLNVKYDERERRLRAMLWGTVPFTQEMLETVAMLTGEEETT